MKKQITIIGNGFASLFFIGYFLAIPAFPVIAYFFRRIYSRYDITVIGNGKFIYFPAMLLRLFVSDLHDHRIDHPRMDHSYTLSQPT